MRAYRLTLGPKFSEGARLLWSARERFASLEEMRQLLDAYRGELSLVLYGDRLPRLELAAKIHEQFQIAPTAWSQAPSVEFTPPALAALEAGKGGSSEAHPS